MVFFFCSFFLSYVLTLMNNVLLLFVFSAVKNFVKKSLSKNFASFNPVFRDKSAARDLAKTSTERELSGQKLGIEAQKLAGIGWREWCCFGRAFWTVFDISARYHARCGASEWWKKEDYPIFCGNG